jgi:hypothetical protein
MTTAGYYRLKAGKAFEKALKATNLGEQAI